MTLSKFDAIVIGAGINGSAAAYSLAKRHKKVLLLDQYSARNTKGSSHGQSRCFRVTYKKQLLATLSQDALKLWQCMEHETGETLFVKNGMLTIFEEVGEAKECIRVLESLQVSHSVLSADQVNQRWPNLRLPPAYCGLFEEGAGTLMADKCLMALQNMFQFLGGVIIEHEKVLKITSGHTVLVDTQASSFKADSVIIAAGAWSNELTKSMGVTLPLYIKGVHVHYWSVCDAALFDISCFPVISFKEPCEIYGMASCERPGMIRLESNFGEPVDPDHREDEPNISKIVEFVNMSLIGVDPTPTITEPCVEDCTPDGDFIVDYLTEQKNIVIGIFSGHGFKQAPVNGEILADLAMGRTPDYDISSFRISRFTNSMLGELQH